MSPAAPGEDAHVDGNTIYIEEVLFDLHKRMHTHIYIVYVLYYDQIQEY